jgi:hypothetical protein
MDRWRRLRWGAILVVLLGAVSISLSRANAAIISFGNGHDGTNHGGTWTICRLPGTGMSKRTETPTILTINAAISATVSVVGSVSALAGWRVETDHVFLVNGLMLQDALSDAGAPPIAIPLGPICTDGSVFSDAFAEHGISTDVTVSDSWSTFGTRTTFRLPEPATLAIWSLSGLCWAGAGRWRRRHGLTQNGASRKHPRTSRPERRAPWPDHVRAAILEIVSRDHPRQMS